MSIPTSNNDASQRIAAAKQQGEQDRMNPQPQSSQQQSQRKSANPDKSKSEKGSLIFNVSNGMGYIFSHKGYFWLGTGIGVSMFCVNVTFYHDLLNKVAGWEGLQQWGGAIAIAAGTTIFEVTPVVWNRNSKTALEMIFAAGSKPTEIPNLDPAVVGDADKLIENYKNSDRNARRFFENSRWVAIALESFLGFIFLGSIGAGLRSLFKLVFFLFSIFGCEWGIAMALRASQWELPPQVREQLASLLSNNDKPLTLRKPQ